MKLKIIEVDGSKDEVIAFYKENHSAVVNIPVQIPVIPKVQEVHKEHHMQTPQMSLVTKATVKKPEWSQISWKEILGEPTKAYYIRMKQQGKSDADIASLLYMSAKDKLKTAVPEVLSQRAYNAIANAKSDLKSENKQKYTSLDGNTVDMAEVAQVES